MKLLTNESNSNSLKIVIASKVSKKPLEIKKNSVENLALKPPKATPQLVLDSGSKIFSSNAAAKLLCIPLLEDTALVNYYLDLEVAVLQPLIGSFSSKANDVVKQNVGDILGKLELELESKDYLVGDKITVADIVIWSALYPLFTEAKLNTEFLNSKNSLKKWFENIHNLSDVQNSS